VPLSHALEGAAASHAPLQAALKARLWDVLRGSRGPAGLGVLMLTESRVSSGVWKGSCSACSQCPC